MIETVTKEYRILACHQPSAQNSHPQIYEALVYAQNPIIARSKINKILLKNHKIKNPIIIKLEDTQEANESYIVKNIGVQFVARHKSGLQNMYKEFRALTRADAVDKLFADMFSRHRISKQNIDIVSVEEVENVRRPFVAQFAKENVSFPVFKKKLAFRNRVFVPITEKSLIK